MDLVDMGKYRYKNKGYYWILTAVEILSRYSFAIPVYRKNTENMTKAVDNLLEQFKTRSGKYPNVTQFDEGKEFHNVGVKTFLESKDVTYFSSYGPKKAAVVERFNRTLKTKMWKYFCAEKTHTWVNVLNDFVLNYNTSKNRSIQMKPVDANKTNEHQV